MNRLYLIALLLLIGFSSIAQDVTNDSYTIQRLLIFNDKGEVLLEQHKNGWMTPAIRHNSKVSTNEGLRDLALEFGLKISPPRLVGIFMFIPDYKPQSSFRQHFTSNLIDGDLILPDQKLDAQWFSPSKAIEMMSLPGTKLIGAVRDMTKQILDYPQIIWGGTFSLWKEDGVTQYDLTENYYPIVQN